jgi:hypothetical protein
MESTPFYSLKAAWSLAACCVLVAVAGVTWTAWDMYAPQRKPMLQGWDDSFYYYWLPAVVIHHDLDFTPLLASSGTVEARMRIPGLVQPRTATGLLPNKYPPGWAMASLPFFLAANVGAPKGATGFEARYLMTVCIGQIFYAVLGLWLAVKIVARYFPTRTAYFAVVVCWLASPLIYYQSVRIWVSHSQVFVLATAMTWVSLELWERKGGMWRWAALGFLAAMLVVTRNLTVVYLIFPAWVAARRLRSFGAASGLFLGALGPVVCQLLAWKLVYGSWILYSYSGEKFDFHHLHLSEIFFSPLHGWFYWHPLLLVGMLGFLFWLPRRPEGWAWMASFAAVSVLNAAWWCWWLASSFGYRGFEVPTLLAMIGLAQVIHATRTSSRLGRLLAVACGVAVAWNLALCTLYLGHRIERQAPVTHAVAARAMVNFVLNRPAAVYP